MKREKVFGPALIISSNLFRHSPDLIVDSMAYQRIADSIHICAKLRFRTHDKPSISSYDLRPYAPACACMRNPYLGGQRSSYWPTNWKATLLPAGRCIRLQPAENFFMPVLAVGGFLDPVAFVGEVHEAAWDALAL